MPCATRATSSRIGASQPTWSNVGRIAITNDPPAISAIVSSIACLRPRRSAYRPSSMPPSGRKKNATAYVAKVPTNAACSLASEKIWVAK